MSDGTDKKEEFDSAGEAIGYISLDQAVLQARRLARQDEERYRDRLGWREIVWVEGSAEHREDSFRIVLKFKPPVPGLRDEQVGEEEFIFGLTGGLEERQVILWPTHLQVHEGAGSAPAPSSEVPSAGAERLRHTGFPESRPMWVPLPVRMKLLIVGLVRHLVERVLSRASKGRTR